MSGLSRFSGRIVAASIGLLGAGIAYASAEHGAVPQRIERWADPVETPYPRGLRKDDTLSSLSEKQRWELQRQMESLEDISARLDTVIESLGFLASDLTDQFVRSDGGDEIVSRELRETIDRFRLERDDYVSPSRTRIVAIGFAEAFNDSLAETQAEAQLLAIQEYVVEQEGMLRALKTAIQSVYSAEKDEIRATMEPLEAAVIDWMEAYGYKTTTVPSVPSVIR